MTRDRWGYLGLGVLAVLTVVLVALAVSKQHSLSAAPQAVPESAVTSPIPTATLTTSQAKPVAVFIGDTYTAGADGQGTRWTTLVSERLGWDEVFLAAAERGT